MSVQQILRDVRTKLDLSGAFVEGSLGLREGELREIENGTLALDTARIDAMAELYGVSAADVVSEVPVADELEAVRVLLLATKDRNRQVSDAFRATVARVAWARRDLKILEEELGLPDRLESLRTRFRHEGTYGQLGEEWREAANLAQQLRKALGIPEDAPVPSVRDVIAQLGIELVAAELGSPQDRDVAGFSLAGRLHGPAIVVNMRGQNANPWVRRFTLAHELCHVLHDELMHVSVGSVQFYDDQTEGPERRANAFAAHFLAPDSAVLACLQKESKGSRADEVQALMTHLGINFKTARYRLRHVWRVPGEELASIAGVATTPCHSSEWFRNEAIWDVDYFPCRSVPHERRGMLARAVVRAWKADILDRRQAAELLHAAPNESLDSLIEILAE
jgi:Zn-dependent peptidase ImmA (M78 family)